MEADILESKEDLYLVPDVWRPICLIKGLVLMVVFCSVRRHNFLVHYLIYIFCHQNS